MTISVKSCAVAFVVQAMKFLCQDLFFSRARGTAPGSSPSLLPRSPPGGRAALESAFKMAAARNPEQRGTVMDALMEAKVHAPAERVFGVGTIADRVAGYAQLSANSTLRKQIQARSGAAHGGDVVAGRIAELKGEKPPASLRRADRRPPPPPPITGQADILAGQLRELRNRCDDMNEELAQVMATAPWPL
jgi:hypothetical protein